MRHRIAGRKFGRSAAHRQAMTRNQVTSLLRYGRITTTEAKAKELRRWVERVITDAKPDDLNARRKVALYVNDREVIEQAVLHLPRALQASARAATPASSSSRRASATRRRWRSSSWSNRNALVPTYSLTLEYDGTDFAGWQTQPSVRTAMGVFGEALRALTSESPSLTAAGRTDAGAHAHGQVVGCVLERAWDPGRAAQRAQRLAARRRRGAQRCRRSRRLRRAARRRRANVPLRHRLQRRAFTRHAAERVDRAWAARYRCHADGRGAPCRPPRFRGVRQLATARRQHRAHRQRGGRRTSRDC